MASPMALKLKQIRKSRNLSQVKLGRMIGVSKQRIWNLENAYDRGSVPIWDSLEAALGVPQQTLRQPEPAPEGAKGTT